MQVVVLAGGRGTRIAALAGEKPKALLEVGGLPFLEHQRRWLEATGAGQIVYSVGYRGDQIRAYVERAESKIPLRVVQEPEPLGTGGALRFLYDAGALEARFLLLYGDSYLQVALIDVWREFRTRGCAALMTVYKNSGALDRSNASVQGGRVEFYSKVDPRGGTLEYIDYGLSALGRDDLADYFEPGVAADLAPYFTQLAARGRLGAFEATERFFEVGSPAGLSDFAAFAAANLTTNSTARPTPV